MLIEELILVNASIETVWRTFTDITHWADWNSVLKDIKFSGNCIEEGATFRCCVKPYLFPIYFEPEIEEVAPFERIAWKGEKKGIRSRHEFLFSRKEKSTEIISRETFSGIPVILAGPLFPIERLRELNAEFLRNLKDAAEQAARNQ